MHRAHRYEEGRRHPSDERAVESARAPSSATWHAPRTTTAIWFTKTSVDTQHPLITLIVAPDYHDYPKAAVAMLKLNCGDG